MRVVATAVVMALLASPGAAQEAPAPPTTVPEALVSMRKDAWEFVDWFTKSQFNVDPEAFPAITRWLKDLEALRTSIAGKAPAAWPVDADALTTSNPHYWALIYDVYPADPMVLNMTAALQMMGGEAHRARHCTALADCTTGRPAILRQVSRRLNWWLGRLFRLSDAAIRPGMAKHDAQDYDGAITIYRAQLAEWPQDGRAHYELGQTLMIRDPENLTKPDAPHAAEYARCRRHRPLEPMAWQGMTPDMVEKAVIVRSEVTPAWAKVESRAADLETLTALSVGAQKLGVHDLALFARQAVVAARLGYSKADREFIATSLRALVPGPVTEATIARLTGPQHPIHSIARFEGPEPDFRWER